MILSKWCLINIINPVSQEDERVWGLSSVTIARNKGPPSSPYQSNISNQPLLNDPIHREGSPLNLWPHINNLIWETSPQIRKHLNRTRTCVTDKTRLHSHINTDMYSFSAGSVQKCVKYLSYHKARILTSNKPSKEKRNMVEKWNK